MLLQVFQRLMALVSLAVLALGGYLIWSWWDLRQTLEAQGVVYEDDIGWRLWAGLALLAVSFLGRTPMLWLLARKGDDGDRLRRLQGRTVETPTGARLHVEEVGPSDAPALVFVHGWGLDAGIWREARLMLAQRYRVIAFDLAGLGRSKGPREGVYTLEGFADDLRAVLHDAAPRQAVLVGHSIGGMTLQTFARRHPAALGTEVAGLVLENTTHTDPTRTTILGKALHAMKPVLAPLMKLDIALSPLVWAMNWQSYLSGGTHLAMRFGGFGTRPTRAQLEQVALAATRNPPAVQAKGNLAMMQWDATADLPRLSVPTLVFIGGRDLVTVPPAGERIARDAPGARPFRVEGAGHLGPMELAQVYNEVIARFADEVFTRGATWADRGAEARLTEAPSPNDRTSGDEVPRRPEVRH
jgi:pimeloyl-ACP methyl ester carboxylesterase